LVTFFGVEMNGPSGQVLVIMHTALL